MKAGNVSELPAVSIWEADLSTTRGGGGVGQDRGRLKALLRTCIRTYVCTYVCVYVCVYVYGYEFPLFMVMIIFQTYKRADDNDQFIIHCL